MCSQPLLHRYLLSFFLKVKRDGRTDGLLGLCVVVSVFGSPLFWAYVFIDCRCVLVD